MAHIAVNHENIFLAKMQDSESTTRALNAAGDSRIALARIDRSTCDLQKPLQQSRFLRS
jgi:hypothetical protein